MRAGAASSNWPLEGKLLQALLRPSESALLTLSAASLLSSKINQAKLPRGFNCLEILEGP